MRRRAYAGAELVINISGSPFRIGIVETRREMIATRAADHQVTLVYANLVGANDGLVFDGGGFVGQNGKMLSKRRASRSAFRPHVDLDRTARLRTENTTWRCDRADYVDAHPRRARSAFQRDCRHQRSRATLTYPVPAHRSFFLPPETTRKPAREELCEDMLDALALGIGDYFEKTGAFKTIGVALSGGRDSLLTLLIAHRYARPRHQRRAGQAAPRVLHAVALLFGRNATTRQHVCQNLGVPLGSSRSTTPSSARWRRPRQMLGGAGTDRDHPAERPGAHSRAADVELGELLGRALPADRQHEREGRRLHHDRRRPDGRAGVIANVPKTVVM